MRVFSRLCARFPGWLPMCFFARTRFLEVCATTFLVDRAGICPHIARRVIGTRGTRCAQNINAPTVGTGGRSYCLGFRVYGKRETQLMLKRISLTMSIDLNYWRREEREREREKREREERECVQRGSEVTNYCNMPRGGGFARGWRAVALGQRRRGWAQRWAVRCAHPTPPTLWGRVGGVGEGARRRGFCSAPRTQRQGRGIRGRKAKCGQFSGASNEPIFAAIGARGAAPRRLQCAVDATSVAVRCRRRVHAHVHFAAVFHIKTLPVLGRSRV
jgi:hypothetical protein